MIEKKIEQLVLEKLTEENFKDCFLVDIELNGKRLNVYLDRDEGITFQICQKVSRFLEGHIDENGWMGEKYILEVSSPGLSRPLKLLRQYYKNVGRGVEIYLNDDTRQEGKLKAVDTEKVVIEQEIIIKEGKKKKKSTIDTDIPFENIAKTIVKFTFKS